MFSIELFWISDFFPTWMEEQSMKVGTSIKNIIRREERFDAEALN